MTPKQTFEAFVGAETRNLVDWLKRTFPRLDLAECEDLVQLAVQQTWEKLCHEPEFSPKEGWQAWLRSVARYRALDFLRRCEALSLEAFAKHDHDTSSGLGKWEPAHPGLSPSAVLRQQEHGQRRQTLLSDVLGDYCRHCEKYGTYTQREVFERSVRGQKSQEIAREMGLAEQRVHEHRSRAFQRIRQDIAHRDPNHSVLSSLFGIRRDRRSVPHEVAGLHAQTFSDLVRFVVDEVGALCPSEERLTDFVQDPNAANLADVRYHVTKAHWYADPAQTIRGCRICQANDHSDFSSRAL